MDVTRNDEVSKAVEAALAHFGRIDELINNAGIYPRLAADAIGFEEWRHVLDINLDGSWRCTQAVVPVFKQSGGGVILNIGSIALQLGMPNLAHYNASKGGIVGLTRSLARDLGRYAIRVNCVHLGAVLTEGERRAHGDAGAVLKKLEEQQALPGRLTPETIEPVFAFLASDESADITGQCLTVDRGWAHG